MSSLKCKWKRRRSSECDYRDPNYVWKDYAMLIFEILLFVTLYVSFVVEFWTSSMRKYLLNIDNTESLESELSRRVNFYHRKTRTIRDTDNNNANTLTQIEKYPVVTFSGFICASKYFIVERYLHSFKERWSEYWPNDESQNI